MIREAVKRLVAEEGIDTYKRFIREVIQDTRQAFVNRVKEFMIWGLRYLSFMDVPHNIQGAQCRTMRRSIR